MANVINMSKNQKISMTKEDGTEIKNFFIGVNQILILILTDFLQIQIEK